MSSENVEVKPRIIRKRSLISLLIFAILFGLWWGVPTYRKARADAMVRELCAKDGGIKVYETVKLAADRFDEYGNPTFGSGRMPSPKRNMKPSDEYFYTWDTTWIIPETSVAALAVWRNHQRLFKVADGKLMGEAISYSRRGGDPIGPWHPSHFGCPPNADITMVVRRVFVKQ
jgi:hypothetical protein